MTLSLPRGVQRRSILDATARLNLWEGSIGSGKTVASMIRWLDFVASGPAGNLLMLGKTERTLAHNVLHPMEELVGPAELKVRAGAGEARLWGRRIYLGGANDESAQTKIRGLNLVGAYGDEVTAWPESAFRTVLGRLRQRGAKFFGTYNPDAPTHWLMREFLSRADELDLARFVLRLEDNAHLDPAFVSSIVSEYTGVWRRRYIDGEWCAAEGAIYDALDESVHLVDEMPELLEHWVGIDYGTTNPTVFLMLSLGVDRCLYVHSEWRHDSIAEYRQMTDAQYSAALRRWLTDRSLEGRDPRWILVDPSAASFRAQLRADGIGAVHPASNTVVPGIRNVSSLLAARRLKFHRPTTTAKGGLWDEMSGYVWDAKAQLRGEDAPLKRDDHGPDALRYAVRGAWSAWRSWLTVAGRDEEVDDAAP